MKALFGDIHNHCGVSYGHGSLADALANARERLDFVSITGHAHWPDMPDPVAEPRLRPVIDFHERGFAKLRENWPGMLGELKAANVEGEFVVFPAFEIHSCAHGDRNVLYRDLRDDAEILYPSSIPDLHRQLAGLKARGMETLSQPHHVGYRRGTRGMDWASHCPEFEPLVELLSMHGCSEDSETPRPFLHVMGPSDFEGTIRHGWESGHLFGVTGGTDHHSAHPGSHGHGLLGVRAENGTRAAIWDAFFARRTWAMTGDRIELDFRVDDAPMGSVLPPGNGRHVEIDVAAGGAVDAVDVLKNGRLVHRISPGLSAVEGDAGTGSIHTKLHLELGWGPRGERFDWDAVFGIDAGCILEVEPRFRGREVVSPLEAETGDGEGEGEAGGFFENRIVERGERAVRFEAVTRGNPNNSTNASQGVCLEVEATPGATIFFELNGARHEIPLAELIRGARSGLLNGLESPAWRIHRAPPPAEWRVRSAFDIDLAPGDFVYARVRQTNDQWAWGTAVFCRA
ncbi:MAG: hypothetical protein H7A53_08020 [Akkermansiaceae bacterium]|nr:hypothetical protein [Akkermansiaceae bacterium]MCP5550820.1 hypothetical protein [Akkermansiaceae bacterium]